MSVSHRQFYQYVTYTFVVVRAHPEWRVGQAAFNALTAFNPDVAGQLSGTINDPFNHDERLYDFFEQVLMEMDSEDAASVAGGDDHAENLNEDEKPRHS